jgi:hypothetical protein
LDKVKIDIDLIGQGSARIDIKDSINTVSIFPSYLFDSLERLLVSILLLNKGLQEAECALFCESPEIMVSFSQTDEIVALKIYAFYDSIERPLKDIIDKSELIFTTQCKRKQLTNQIINAYYHLQEKYGIEGYKKMWKNEFPERKFIELQELIRKQK